MLRRAIALTVAVTTSLVATAVIGAPTASATADHRPSNPTVRVDQGVLRGFSDDGAEQFLDIPYAQPPTQDLRFAPPQPATSWRGVRDATQLPPACTQFGPGGVSAEQATSEDCLYLNVYRPIGTRRNDHLPVIFWIHGGGWTSGTADLYGGQTMASRQRAVVVSINYRLGAFGFLAVPQLGAYAGELGLLDQIQALKWVHNNISAFGGNPNNLTIDGQSAGGGSVCAMLASPMTGGLFQKAIIQSGPCQAISFTSRDDALNAGAQFVKAAGCDTAGDVLACLRSAAPADLVAAQNGAMMGPAYGGAVVPAAPADAIAAGKWNKVPVIIGSNRWELKLALAFIFGQNAANVTDAQYQDVARNTFGPIAAAVLQHYPAANYPKPAYALAAALTDSAFACPTYEMSAIFGRQVRTYEYEFDDPTSPTLSGFDIPGIDMSSAHSADLAYLWNFTFGARPLSTSEEVLAGRMQRYWGTFAWTGIPSPSWPRVTTSQQPVLKLQPGHDVTITDFASEHQCGFWANPTGTGDN